MAKECIPGSLEHSVQLPLRTSRGRAAAQQPETLAMRGLAANQGVNGGARTCFSIGPEHVTRKQVPSAGGVFRVSWQPNPFILEANSYQVS